MRVLITRPEDDAITLAQHLASLGIASMVEPLLDIHYLAGDQPDLSGVQALIFTSANGVRAFARRCARRDLPALAVGDATAQTARDAGFTTVESAAGDVFALAELIRHRRNPAAGTLLHPAGAAVAGDLGKLLEGDGFTVRRETFYEAQTAEALTPRATDLLRKGRIDGVVVFSPRTAAILIELIKAADLSAHCVRVTAFCLSWAVAAVVETESWRQVRVAARPEQTALIDMIAEAADFFSPSGRNP